MPHHYSVQFDFLTREEAQAFAERIARERGFSSMLWRHSIRGRYRVASVWALGDDPHRSFEVEEG